MKLIISVIGVAAGVVLIVAFGLGYVSTLIGVPEIVLSVPSPDRSYEAYVEEWPSFDPPNQSLWVERGNKTYFMHIAELAEDIDFIQEIVWSPDSQIVVFHSNDYLTATRVADWRTVRIYLGREWRRAKAQRHHTTFTSVEPSRQVEAIEFPKNGCFTYRLEGAQEVQVVSMEF